MLILSRWQRFSLDWLHGMAIPLGLMLCTPALAPGQQPDAPTPAPALRGPATDQPAAPAPAPANQSGPVQNGPIQQSAAQPPVHRLQSPNERMEMIVNTSRLVTLDESIPKLAVNNPDILSITPLSPNEVQVSAKKTGVTQVNLWGASGKIYTLDVMVIGDARELAMMLRSQFPNASLKVMPLPNSVIISGNVDDATQVNQIIDIAEDFYPKVHNQIVVGGVQQVLLQVRVMEVSRSKLRTLGVDFADLASNGAFMASGPSGLLKMAQVPISTVPLATAVTGGAESLSFGVVSHGSEFFGFLNALRTDGLARVLAEPNLVTVSGRPAYFNVGGQIPVPIPQSLGTISIQYKPYGTQVDFVPIVLGNGAIRLEVRPSISEIDTSLSVPINGTNVPALVVREIDTGVEMRPGQTLAIAGLVQNRIESTKTGIPWVMDMPYIGVLFRKNTEQMNEVELLILVTPQLIEAMDPHEVPPCGPGSNTNSPTDAEFYLKGYMEVPNLCNPGAQPWPAGAAQASAPAGSPAASAVVPEPGVMPQRGYMMPQPGMMPRQGSMLPPQGTIMGPAPQGENIGPPPAGPGPAAPLPPTFDNSSTMPSPNSTDYYGRASAQSSPSSRAAGPRLSSQPAASVGYDRNNPDNRSVQQSPSDKGAAKSLAPAGFIGPLGYDVVQ
ncbi:MAG TPA: type II and III secretion system protein family protein [Pirellulales bacterium]|jgi:pilus assembly protein CpaC|nr:type II and III secretion system protein family protein [Pirellulales bacterium]